MANEKVFFKRGLSSNLAKTSYVNGQLLFTTDDGKLYIDTSSSASGRVAVNASYADLSNSANKLTVNAGSSTRPIYFGGGVPLQCAYSLNKDVPANAVFTDTHYTANFWVTNSATGASSVATSNPYITLIENGSRRSYLRLIGGGGTSISSDSDGNITITSPSSLITVDSALSSTSTNPVQNKVINTALGNYLPLTGGTLTGALKVTGRYQNSGDDEGLVVGLASNNYAGVCLGNPSGIRTVFYLKNTNEAFWRLNNGGAISYDIYHPAKSGTIALTSDLEGVSSAIKLTTSAGSSTLPIYFSDGKPVACSSNLNVNITGAASRVYDSQNSQSIAITYSKAGQSSTSWLASWNGYELGAISPSKITVGSADRLTTARNISLTGNLTGTATFDGSGDISINGGNYYSTINTNNTATYPYHRIAYVSGITGQYVDRDMILEIRHCFSGGGFGRLKISYRSTTTGNGPIVYARWLYRYNINADSVSIGYWGVSGDSCYADLFYKYSSGWARAEVTQVQGGRGWTLVSSYEATDAANHTECWASIDDAATALHSQAYSDVTSAIDVGYVQGANFTSSDGSMKIYGMYNNEVNFGGSHNSSRIYFGYRAADSKPIPTEFVMGGTSGTATVYTGKCYGAVWNDYAEYRESSQDIEPGRVLQEVGDDTLIIADKRLTHFAGVCSDTYGFAIGESQTAKTPIAVSGRVLVYPYQPRENYSPGDCVCTAPNGTVDIMTREEIINYPDRIVGIVSCVPDYDIWYCGPRDNPNKIPVKGRIWIKVK